MYNNNNNKNNNRNTSIVIMELINSLIVFIYHLQVPLNKKKNPFKQSLFISAIQLKLWNLCIK